MSCDTERLLTDDEEDKLASLNLTPKQAKKVREIWQSEAEPKKPIKNDLPWNILLTVVPIIFLINYAFKGPLNSVTLIIALILIWYRIGILTITLLPSIIILATLSGRRSYLVFTHGCLNTKEGEYQKKLNLNYLYSAVTIIALFFARQAVGWRCYLIVALITAIINLLMSIKINRAMAMAEAE